MRWPARLQSWLDESIAHRISFAAAGLSASFVLLIGLLSFAMTQSLMRASIEAEMDSELKLVEERLSHELTTAAKGIENLARSTLVANALVDSAGRASYLEPYLRDYQLAASIPFTLALSDHAGQLVATNRAGIGVPLSAATLRRRIDANQPFAEIIPESPPRLLLGYPVIYPATNTAEGMLLLNLPWTELLRHLFAAGQRHDGIEVFSGDMLVHALADRPVSGQRITTREALTVPPPLQALRLEVRDSRSWLSVYRPLLVLVAVYVVISVLALALAARMSRRVAQKLVAPLQVLTEAARRNQTEADAGGVDFPVTGQDEPGQLGQALQHMLEQLRAEHDLLERRVAERTAELNDLAYIVRRTSNGVVVTDPRGLIEWVNEGFERISGYALDEVRGRKPGELLQGPDTDPAMVALMARQIAAGEGFAVELVNYHKNGRPYWIAIDAQPIRDAQGRIEKFVALETDITERKRVEQLKTDFVSVVSHELRTPLTAIRGALGLIAGGVVGELPSQAREMTALALANSERLTNLIDDLLDIQKLESGRMQFSLSSCDLPTLLRRALTLNQPYAQKHGIGIVLAEPVPALQLRLDESRFQQIMANLLSNAVKFSPTQGTVEIAAEVRDGGRACLRVTDHGDGIPEEFRSRIFQKFSQADSSDSRAKAGTGLGLNITKALVEGMGGEISFVSHIGQGTTFEVTFPMLASRPVTS